MKGKTARIISVLLWILAGVLIASAVLAEDGALHVTADSDMAGVRVFSDQIPMDLPVGELTDKGWKPTGGVIWDTEDYGEKNGIRSDVFLICERNGEHSVTLFHRGSGKEWHTAYYGTKMISPNARFEVKADLLYANPFLLLTYVTENDEKVQAGLVLRDGECHLRDCSFTDQQTGNSFHLEYRDDSDFPSWRWMEIKDGLSSSGRVSCAATSEYAAMFLSELPRGPEILEQWQQEVVPDGYVMIKGVHLRKEKSSHSTDLGMFKAGAIVQFLGKEEGNPYFWARVRVGNLEGYMAGNYICLGETGDRYYSEDLLPIVKTKNDTVLRPDMGDLNVAAVSLQAGTKMHVLAEYDPWYYVVVPQNEIQEHMDVFGTYGYIAKDQVESSTLFDPD